jgi:hypothetical protein
MFFKQILNRARSFLERFIRHGSDGAEGGGHAPLPKQLGHYAACMISRDSLPN